LPKHKQSRKSPANAREESETGGLRLDGEHVGSDAVEDATAPISPPNTMNRKEAKVAMAPDLPPYPDAIGPVERASSLATTKKARPHTMERTITNVHVSVAERADALSPNPKAEVIPPKVPPYSAGKRRAEKDSSCG